MTEPGYAVRALLKTPAFVVVNAVLLRPLPYPESDRIVSFAWRTIRLILPGPGHRLASRMIRRFSRSLDEAQQVRSPPDERLPATRRSPHLLERSLR